MRYIKRALEKELAKTFSDFPAILLTGPRRAGKTTLLRKAFPHASYVLLEDPDIIGRFKSDPRTFLDELRLPVILDEVQNVPELLSYVRSRIDKHPRKMGRWLLTGSHEAPLMKGVTESMAGRAAVFTLLPMSVEESSRVNVLRGGFPEVLANPSGANTWFRSYIQTYLERDVRLISEIRDLAVFRRFMALSAARCGSVLNRADIAAGLGVSVPTVSQWLSILEITQQIILVPPFFENFGKRIIKSPRLYFTDTGLLCHLLGIGTMRELEKSPFYGHIFESFVISEIVKRQLNTGKRREIYYYRDSKGLEVDAVIPLGARHVLLLEIKTGRTVFPRDAEPVVRLRKLMRSYTTDCFIVHRPSSKAETLTAVKPGVRAVGLETALSNIR